MLFGVSWLSLWGMVDESYVQFIHSVHSVHKIRPSIFSDLHIIIFSGLVGDGMLVRSFKSASSLCPFGVILHIKPGNFNTYLTDVNAFSMYTQYIRI